MKLRIVAAGFVCLLGCISTGQGKVRSYADLSASDRQALDNSTRREIIYDRTLSQLDADRTKHRISSKDYERRRGDLVQYIGDEAAFQNAILVPHKSSRHKTVKEPGPEDPGSEVAATLDKALDDWGHYLVDVPAALAGIALSALGSSHATISP